MKFDTITYPILKLIKNRKFIELPVIRNLSPSKITYLGHKSFRFEKNRKNGEGDHLYGFYWSTNLFSYNRGDLSYEVSHLAFFTKSIVESVIKELPIKAVLIDEIYSLKEQRCVFLLPKTSLGEPRAFIITVMHDTFNDSDRGVKATEINFTEIIGNNFSRNDTVYLNSEEGFHYVPEEAFRFTKNPENDYEYDYEYDYIDFNRNIDDMSERDKFIYINLRALLFYHFAQIEQITVNHSTRRKSHLNNCTYETTVKTDIKIIDSTWFTSLINTGAFKVRGHFRLQPHGEGMKKRKLIWIKDFDKSGYKREAKIISKENA